MIRGEGRGGEGLEICEWQLGKSCMQTCVRPTDVAGHEQVYKCATCTDTHVTFD